MFIKVNPVNVTRPMLLNLDHVLHFRTRKADERLCDCTVVIMTNANILEIEETLPRIEQLIEEETEAAIRLGHFANRRTEG